MLAVGDEDLRAGQAVAVAVAGGAGAGSPARRSRRRARSSRAPPTSSPVTIFGSQRDFCSGGAVGEDVVRDDRGVDAEAPAREVGAGLRHQDHGVVAEVAAGAAVFRGDRGAEEADSPASVQASRSIMPCARQAVERGAQRSRDEVAGERLRACGARRSSRGRGGAGSASEGFGRQRHDRVGAGADAGEVQRGRGQQARHVVAAGGELGAVEVGRRRRARPWPCAPTCSRGRRGRRGGGSRSSRPARRSGSSCSARKNSAAAWRSLDAAFSGSRKSGFRRVVGLVLLDEGS